MKYPTLYPHSSPYSGYRVNNEEKAGKNGSANSDLNQSIFFYNNKQSFTKTREASTFTGFEWRVACCVTVRLSSSRLPLSIVSSCRNKVHIVSELLGFEIIAS